MMSSRLTNHITANKLFYNIFAVCLFFVVLAIYLNYRTLETSQTTYLAQINEKKAWTQLELFQSQTKVLVDDFFTTSLTTVENLAKDPGFLSSLDGDHKDAQLLLASERTINSRFDSLNILDSKGTVVMLSSQTAQANSYLGTSLADRAYFTNPLKTQQPYISASYTSVVGSTLVAFSVPVLHGDQVAYVVSGFVKIDSLGGRLKLTSRLANFNSLLTDSEGKAILEGNKPLTAPVDIHESDHVVSRMLAGAANVEDQEPDSNGVDSLVRGDIVKVGDAGTFYLLSYYSVAQLSNDKAAVQAELDRIITVYALRDLFIFLICAVVIREIMGRHGAIPPSKKS